MHPDVRFTLGAVLGGSLFSTALYGSLCLQTFLYFKQYPNDSMRLKSLVTLVWITDTAHTGCVVLLSYQYLIENFARPEIADHIFKTVVASIQLTALLTFTVHSFFAYKVHKLSQCNWWLTGPTLFCMFSRLGLAITTVVEMWVLESFELYGQRFAPVLSTALSFSAATDLIITCGLCYYLRTLNPEMYRSKRMLSTIVSFTDSNGALTCIVALSIIICWIAMPTTLVYLGLHFTIGKCYSNSLLATLNMRNYVKQAAADVIGIMNPTSKPQQFERSSYPMMGRPLAPPQWSELDLSDENDLRARSTDGTTRLAVKIDRIVQYDD